VAGIVVEMLLRFLFGKKHIREIQLFPRIPGEEVIF
jgi:aspartyl/asparaginyl-tRNA synthetase